MYSINILLKLKSKCAKVKAVNNLVIDNFFVASKNYNFCAYYTAGGVRSQPRAAVLSRTFNSWCLGPNIAFASRTFDIGHLHLHSMQYQLQTIQSLASSHPAL